MPPKRKAAATTGRAPKRVASGVSTPVSIDESEDDYSMGSESDPEERAAPLKYDSQLAPRISFAAEPIQLTNICRNGREVLDGDLCEQKPA